MLYKVLREHWKTFLAEIESVADPPALPAFVVSEVGAFLRGGRMEILAAVTSRAGVTRILEHLGLPTDAPAFHPARPPPQADLPLDAAPAFEADPPASDEFGV